VRDSEEHLLSQVVETLVAAFPHLPEGHVRDCVLEVHRSFADAKIRTYLPILVSRRARAVLAGTLPAVEAVPRVPPGLQLSDA
jgi:hypothetical protein